MMLSLCSVAFAATFSDTTDLDQDAQASIAKLNALNIINGYPDGTFKPGNNITRAEFAKIACIAGGMGASAEMLASSPSKFSDVAAGQWYTGYVNLANSQGWVKGFPDGTFRPNNQITYAEVITVLVRILGYNDNLPGPWPVDYIAKAGQIDITEDVSFDANAPATRSDVAVMTDATLDCDVVKWDNDTEDFEEEDYTLLEDKFDTALNEDYLITETDYDDGVWSIKVTATDEDEDDLDSDWLDLAEDCMVSDGSLPTGLNNKMVDILYNDDDEEVLYMEVTSTTVTVDGEDWEVAKTTSVSGTAYPSQYEIDDTKYDVADWVLDSISNVTSQLAIRTTAGFEEDGFYRAWLNEDKDIYRVAARSKDTPAIVEAYEDGELTVKVEGNHDVYDEIEDIDFEDDSVLIEKDGALVGPEDLEENDVIYVDEDSYGYDYYIEVAGTISKTGTFSGYRENSSDPNEYDQIRIDGTWYDVAEGNALSEDEGAEFDEDDVTASNLEDYDDEVITYFLNKANQVTFVISGEVGSGSSSRIYGVVTDLGYTVTRDGTKVSEITVLKADGTEVDYDVDTSEVELYMDADEAPDDATHDILDIDDFIKFTVDEDNDIDGLTILAQTTGSNTSIEVIEPDDDIDSDYIDNDNDEYIGDITDGDDDNNRIKFNNRWYTLSDSTVIFNGETYRDDDAEVIDLDDLVDWASELSGSATAYVEYDGNKAKYIYVNHDVSSSVGGDYAAITELFEKSRDPWAEVDINGEIKEYEIKDGSDIAEVGGIYDYTLSSGDIKFDELKFDPTADDDFAIQSVSANVYASDDATRPNTSKYYIYKVEQVDKGEQAVKVNGTWIYADDETAVYNYDGGIDDVESAKISTVGKNDYVVFFGDESELDLLVIVTDLVD
ncbi:MAG: S-layer homology domain-containing protein [Dehalobacterium sp.]